MSWRCYSKIIGPAQSQFISINILQTVPEDYWLYWNSRTFKDLLCYIPKTSNTRSIFKDFTGPWKIEKILKDSEGQRLPWNPVLVLYLVTYNVNQLGYQRRHILSVLSMGKIGHVNGNSIVYKRAGREREAPLWTATTQYPLRPNNQPLSLWSHQPAHPLQQSSSYSSSYVWRSLRWHVARHQWRSVCVTETTHIQHFTTQPVSSFIRSFSLPPAGTAPHITGDLRDGLSRQSVTMVVLITKRTTILNTQTRWVTNLQRD